MALTIRPARPSDAPALLALFAEVFRTTPDPAEWRWKYEENPCRAASIAAFADGEAVGFFGAFATRYRGARGSWPGTSGVDVMTRTSARRVGHTGVYREMGQRFVEENLALGVPFYFGFPHERARVVGERLLGYRTVEAAGQWSRPLPPPPGFLSRLRRFRRRVVSGTSLSPGHDALAEAVHAREGLRPEKSREVLEWRYGRRPGVGYRFVELLDARGRSRAFAAVRLVGERALLVDLQAADERGGEVVDLLDGVSELVRPLGARTLELRAARRSGIAAAARDLGFSEAPSDTWLMVIPVDGSFPLDEVAPGFDYRFGDHDVF